MKKNQIIKGTICCVPGCYSDSAKNRNVSFHKFPNDLQVRKIWIQRVNRRGKSTLWEPTKNHRICGLHFNTSGKKAYEDKYPRFFPYKTYPFKFYETVIAEDFSSCYSRSVGNEVIITTESTLECEKSLTIPLEWSDSETLVLSPGSIKKEENDYSLIISEHSYSLPFIDHNSCGSLLKQFKEEINKLHCELKEKFLIQRNKELEDTSLDLERRLEEKNEIILSQQNEIDFLTRILEAQN